MKWTFGISTSGTETENLRKVIKSINDLGIPNNDYEIILALEDNVPDIPCRQILIPKKKPFWISKKKNELIKNANFENICLVHDYLVFHKGWYEGYEEYDNKWKICTNHVRNLSPTGPRIADWIGWTKGGQLLLLPYDHYTDRMFISGMYFCVKKSFIEGEDLYFNEGYFWGGAEDQEWSARCRKVVQFSFNPKSTNYSIKNKKFDFLREANPEDLP